MCDCAHTDVHAGEDLRQLLRHELKDVAVVAVAPMPHIKGVLYPRTVPQVAFDADYALLRAVRYAPKVRALATALQSAIAEKLRSESASASEGSEANDEEQGHEEEAAAAEGPEGAASLSSSPPSHKQFKYLGVHIRRKGEAVKMAAGSTRDDGTKATSTVMLGVVDKDIYFEPDQARRRRPAVRPVPPTTCVAFVGARQSPDARRHHHSSSAHPTTPTHHPPSRPRSNPVATSSPHETSIVAGELRAEALLEAAQPLRHLPCDQPRLRRAQVRRGRSARLLVLGARADDGYAAALLAGALGCSLTSRLARPASD